MLGATLALLLLSNPVIVNCTLSMNPIVLVQPTYPPLAKRARVSGYVTVKIVVNQRGRVTKATVLSGHPLLNVAALKAARSSRFEPLRVGRKVVKAEGIISYRFRLPEGG